jgi:acyl-coenzyme A synthetase/AMP-(fatty) acid ligase
MAVREIFHWAERTPDQTAVIQDGGRISYGEFARSIAFARGYFVRLGWSGSGFVAVAIADLTTAWITMLALRSLGLTTIVLREPTGVGDLPLPGLRVVTVPTETWPGLEQACAAHGIELLSVSPNNETPLPLDAGPDLPLGGHILETSGTTGTKKMVLMDPSFEGEYLRPRRELTGIDAESIVAVFNFHANTGVGHKAPTNVWTVGGAVVFQQSRDLRETLRIPGLTHASMVPSMLLGVLDTPAGSFPFQPAMKLSITGGTITQAQIDEAKARITPHLLNGLGATESHTIASTELNTPDDHRWHTIAPTSQVEIVGEDDRPVAVGEIGRLRIGAAGGPSGYLFDEEATRAHFKDGFFYTGDLAVARADGRIALHGRVTEVINMYGHKIAPAPIEDRLRETLGVGGVCLFSMQDENGEEGLHAIVETPTAIDAERLAVAFRAENFGDVRVHFVAALPRNAMGKLMRQQAKTAVLQSL